MSWEAGESWEQAGSELEQGERAGVSWEAGESWEQAGVSWEARESWEQAGSELGASWSKGSKLE